MIAARMTGSSTDTQSAPRAARYAHASLALLFAINLFNYVDRQVLAAVAPDIRRDLLLSSDPNDPNAKAKIGLLSTAFLITYMTLSPVFGILAERFSRWWIIGIGVGLWSIASGASGLASTFGLLLLTRCFVGLGEAAYAPVAPTLLSDYYPISVRGKILAFFNVALPVGGALGYALGGQLASIDPAHQSWRWAFYAVVIPGMILALICFFKRDPQRGAADAATSHTHTRWRDYLVLLKTPSYILVTVGMTAMTFAIGGIAWWMPDYLQTRHVPGVGSMEARTLFGAITALAGLIATLSGGFLGDALRKKFPGSYFLISGIALILGCPIFLLIIYTPFPYAWIFLFLTVFLLFFNAGPTNTILANVTHPAVRATGFAVNIFVIHTLGDALSPPLIGVIADRFNQPQNPAHGLNVGFAFTTLLMILGGATWLWGARFLATDTAAAPHRLA
jgi:MFS family permease